MEYAILETVINFGENGGLEAFWSGWQSQMRGRGIGEAELAQYDDLKGAFKRIWKKKYVLLEKFDPQKQEFCDYSGNDVDDSKFFFWDRFKVKITNEEGRKYWDSIREEARVPIGFRA